MSRAVPLSRRSALVLLVASVAGMMMLVWPLLVRQPAERNMGARQTRRPLSAASSSHPSCGMERSATVVTPDSSISL